MTLVQALLFIVYAMDKKILNGSKGGGKHRYKLARIVHDTECEI